MWTVNIFIVILISKKKSIDKPSLYYSHLLQGLKYTWARKIHHEPGRIFVYKIRKEDTPEMCSVFGRRIETKLGVYKRSINIAVHTTLTTQYTM